MAQAWTTRNSLAALLLVIAVPGSAGAEDIGHGPAHRYVAGEDPLAGDSGMALEEGRNAVFATLANLLGRLYDGAKVKLGLDAPDPVLPAVQPATRSLQYLSQGTLAVQRLSLKADPRGYLSRGIAADTAVSVLGLDSRLGLQLGTETVRQSFALAGNCASVWLPNDITSSFSASREPDGLGAWKGYLRTSWGSACKEGQVGWRLTAGMRDLGTETVGSLGVEYRPARFTPLSDLAGIQSLRAGMVGERGQVAAELTMWELQGRPVRLDAGLNWQEDGEGSLRLGTRLKF